MFRRFAVVILFLSFCAPFFADIPFDFDKEYRREFKGIIIHHTGTESDYPSVKFLSDVQKITVYKPVFDGMGVKMYSNHFYSDLRPKGATGNQRSTNLSMKRYDPSYLYNGKETFFCYHWIVYPDGKKIQVLKDIFKAKDGKWYIDNMAWNAGSWEVNGQTVAIVIAGNYMNRVPTKKALETAAGIIAEYKKKTGIDLEVLGHREVKATECPGNRFLGVKGWKKTLLKMVEDWKSNTVAAGQETDAE